MTPPTTYRNYIARMVGQMQKEELIRFPSRKSPRMKHYDYSKPNYYFVTICTHNKRCIFGNPGQLNHRGRLAEQGIPEIEKHFASVSVDKYVVMPNHIHMILILESGSAALPIILGQYKSYVTKQIHSEEPEQMVWQVSFHDHVIRNQRSYENIWRYIEANPANWEKFCFFTG